MTIKARTYIHFIISEVTSIATGPSAPPIIPTESDSELHPNKPSTQTNAKTNATNFFTPITPFSTSYLSFCFIASFAFVLQRCLQRGCRAKPIPLCRAVPWCRRCIKQNLSLRREQAPALRYGSSITHIGKENKFSAKILLLLAFVLYDIALTRLISFYIIKLRNRLKF